jgi:microsomal dipeptidase-like Zn-dependent dipeptidase
MRRALIVLVVVGVATFFLLDRLLPGVVERSLNRVVPHDPWPVGDAARALHASVPVVDLHADPLLWKRDWLERSTRGHTDLPRLVEGGVALQVMTAVTKTPSGQNYRSNASDAVDTLTFAAVAQLWPPATWTSLLERALHQARILAELDRRAGDAFRVVRSRADLVSLLEERDRGRATVGALFGIEGAHALEGDLANLDVLEAHGLRVVGLTHFFDNRLGGSLHGVSGEGLTDFGRRVVVEAGRRSMIVDVAHASPRMVEDVLALSERPVILSHGGFAGLCDSGRNLDDALMQRIAAHGGLIGVGYWDGAVCDETPLGVVRAIRYGIDLVGVDHVALGSDYDGATTVRFDASELPVLTQAMLDEGFSESEIRQVLGDNAVRFFLAQLP